MNRIDEIKARFENITPGQWQVGPVSKKWVLTAVPGESSPIARIYSGSESDTEFIAHAPDDIAFLISELERYQVPRGGEVNLVDKPHQRYEMTCTIAIDPEMTADKYVESLDAWIAQHGGNNV